jgi:hypothetical protein
MISGIRRESIAVNNLQNGNNVGNNTNTPVDKNDGTKYRQPNFQA